MTTETITCTDPWGSTHRLKHNGSGLCKGSLRTRDFGKMIYWIPLETARQWAANHGKMQDRS